MLAMAEFVDYLTGLIERAVKENGVSKNAILTSFGFDPSQYRRYIRDGLAFSETMLKGIAESKYLEVSYQELKAVQLLDELDQETIKKLFEIQDKKWGLSDK